MPGEPDHRELLSILVEATSSALFAVQEQRVIYANPAAEQLTGRSLAELKGMAFLELIDAEQREKTAELMGGSHRMQVTTRITCKDQLTCPVQLSCQPVQLGGQAAWIITITEQLSEAIVRAIADAVVVYGVDGIVLQANPASEQFYGFDPTGYPQHEILRTLSVRRLDGRPISLDELPSSRALRGERVENERMIITNRIGKERVVAVSTAPIYHGSGLAGAVVVWHDFTEREQLLGMLEEQQARLQAVIENAPEAIVMADTSGQVVLSNPAAKGLFEPGQPTGADAESQAPQFCYPDGTPYRPADLPLSRAIREGKPQMNIEAALHTANGKRRALLISAAPIVDRRGKPAGAVAVFQDISQRKRDEESIRRESARMELVATLSQAFAEAGLYYPSVLGTISRRVAESLGNACIIRLVSDDGQWLDPVAFHHTNPDALAIYRTMLRASRKRVNETLGRQGLPPDEPLVVLDMSASDLQSLDQASAGLWGEQYPVQTALLVPLRAQGHFIGTLTVVRSSIENPFTLEDQMLIQDLADRAGLAIDNARLYAAETQRAHELEALHHAATALLANLDLDSLLGQILETARSAIPTAEKGLLHLADQDSGEFKVRAMLGYQNPTIRRSNRRDAPDYLMDAIRQRRALLFNDLPGASKPGGSSNPRSVIVAPLVLGQSVLGALSLTSARPGAFGEADMRLLVSLAATTTAAIQNALLHSQVQRLAVTDDLTEQYNRRGFFELGEREIERFHRFGRELSIIMLDIDHFKEINDAFGHAVGDQVLATLARRCRTHIRQVDVLGRYGGEEFVILLPETDMATAAEIAERIRSSIASEPVATPQGEIALSISLGVASATPEVLNLAALLDRADAAMYQAKQKGRNRVEVTTDPRG
ncbi:MAG: diguanylate cyclase [Anaerolineaceae bacterium]|nr:diguanylate cyclase [Anaerolineaceae bacterium]